MSSNNLKINNQIIIDRYLASTHSGMGDLRPKRMIATTSKIGVLQNSSIADLTIGTARDADDSLGARKFAKICVS